MVEINLELELRTGVQKKTFRDAAKGLTALSQGAISFDKLDPVIRKTMLVFLRAISDQMRSRHSGAWPGGTGAKSLSRRTGALLRTIEKSVKVTGKFTGTGEVRGQIGSPLIYASTQEFGATIRPKRAQYLTVPLPAALNANGMMKLPKARDYPRTFVARSRRGNLIIFQKKGRGKIIPLFVLKRQVRIPPRLNLGVAVEAGSRALGPRIVNEVVKEFRAGRI